MGTPVEGPPSLGGHGAQQQQQNDYEYDPRGNGISRQPTNPLDMQTSQTLSPAERSTSLNRSPTDPGKQQMDLAGRDKPRTGRSGKICGKCGGGLTGQFVRALGDTYHLECFTCHVRVFLSSPACALHLSAGSGVVWRNHSERHLLATIPSGALQNYLQTELRSTSSIY
jgi:hypothetical protein